MKCKSEKMIVLCKDIYNTGGYRNHPRSTNIPIQKPKLETQFSDPCVFHHAINNQTEKNADEG